MAKKNSCDYRCACGNPQPMDMRLQEANDLVDTAYNLLRNLHLIGDSEIKAFNERAEAWLRGK